MNKIKYKAKGQCRKKMQLKLEMGYSAEDKGLLSGKTSYIINVITCQVIGKMIVVRHIAFVQTKCSCSNSFKRGGGGGGGYCAYITLDICDV